MRCQICGHSSGKNFIAREMMFGTRDEFEYFECGDCGCLQLATPPRDMAEYYPPHYYSFKSREPVETITRGNPLRRWLAGRRNEAQLFARGGMWGAIASIRPNPLMKLPSNIPKIPNLRFTSRILDIGCGGGELLVRLAELGFKDLNGADPYLKADSKIGGKIQIQALDVEDITDGPYDLIMLHHSLEHICDQWLTMKSVAKLLKPGGNCIIRIPSSTSTLWRDYGVDWVELDAPRHFVLHSHQSLRKLTNGCGLNIANITCDDDEFGFWGSELYRRGIPLFDHSQGCLRDPLTVFSRSELVRFRERSIQENRKHLGGRFVAHLIKQ